jgi:hypothetical protein
VLQRRDAAGEADGGGVRKDSPKRHQSTIEPEKGSVGVRLTAQAQGRQAF